MIAINENDLKTHAPLKTVTVSKNTQLGRFPILSNGHNFRTLGWKGLTEGGGGERCWRKIIFLKVLKTPNYMLLHLIRLFFNLKNWSFCDFRNGFNIGHLVQLRSQVALWGEPLVRGCQWSSVFEDIVFITYNTLKFETYSFYEASVSLIEPYHSKSTIRPYMEDFFQLKGDASHWFLDILDKLRKCRFRAICPLLLILLNPYGQNMTSPILVYTCYFARYSSELGGSFFSFL